MRGNLDNLKKMHTVINYIWIDETEITVGITDSERWQWDTEEGMSGADARTMLWVSIIDNGAGYAYSEKVNIFCARSEKILRSLAISVIEILFDIAWDIKEQQFTSEQAKKLYFGKILY